MGKGEFRFRPDPCNNAHKKALRLWEPKPKRVQFAWTPTNSSWLNLIEAWFSLLERTALHNTHF